jgi:hypothetical protein
MLCKPEDEWSPRPLQDLGAPRTRLAGPPAQRQVTTDRFPICHTGGPHRRHRSSALRLSLGVLACQLPTFCRRPAGPLQRGYEGMVAAQTEEFPLGPGIRAYSSRTTSGAFRGGRGVPLWFLPSGRGQVP